MFYPLKVSFELPCRISFVSQRKKNQRDGINFFQIVPFKIRKKLIQSNLIVNRSKMFRRKSRNLTLSVSHVIPDDLSPGCFTPCVNSLRIKVELTPHFICNSFSVNYSQFTLSTSELILLNSFELTLQLIKRRIIRISSIQILNFMRFAEIEVFYIDFGREETNSFRIIKILFVSAFFPIRIIGFSYVLKIYYSNIFDLIKR